jgi:hemoglobin/transferrin/lactoferrin receptor protein
MMIKTRKYLSGMPIDEFASLSQIAIIIVMGVAIAPAALADAGREAVESINYFDTLVVTSSKTEQKLSEVAGSMEVLGEQDIQEQIIDSVQGLFLHMPAVNVGGGNGRGEGAINVRGITGNRILITLDGVRQPKVLDYGALTSSRYYIDINALKQVEVVPGPASSLYGSDALGGVVAFTTKDPEDIYRGSVDGSAGSVSATYNSGNKGLSSSFQAAGKSGDTRYMAIVSHAEQQEMKTTGKVGGTGSTRTIANPNRSQNSSALVKIKQGLGDDDTLEFAAEHSVGNSVTDYESGATTSNRGSYSDYVYDDDKAKTRLSLAYQTQAKSSWYDDLQVSADWQSTAADQYQTYAYSGTERTYDADYRENNLALKGDAGLGFESDGLVHSLTYGVSYETGRFEQWRDSSSTGIARGMPVTKANSYAVYVQDLLQLVDSGWSFVPGLRYDNYKISAHPDADFLAINPWDADPKDNAGNQLSFKVGSIYDFGGGASFFAQFAQGFKAPDMDELYKNYVSPHGYALKPNPALKPESVNAIEVGVRVVGEESDYELVAFDNNYDNFIDTVTDSSNPSYPYGLMQSQNLQGVHIQGVEIKGGFDVNDATSVQMSIAYAEGTYVETGVSKALDSVSPLTASMSLAYDEGDWGGQVSMLAGAGKKSADISGTALPSSGYGVVNMTYYKYLTGDMRLDAGIYNLTNKEYYAWESSRHVGSGASFSEPARHFKVSLKQEF